MSQGFCGKCGSYGIIDINGLCESCGETAMAELEKNEELDDKMHIPH